MKRHLRLAAGLGVIGLVGAVVPAIGVAPAGAVVNPTIVVTTTADVVDGSDGVLSLREAVALANATAGDDTIQLADGATYGLTLCAGNTFETDNAIGDLDGTGADGLTITGSPVAVTAPTIHQSCSQRVINQAAGALTLSHLHVTGGNSTGGASVRAGGALTLDHVDESGAAVSGAQGADAAIYAGGRPVSVVDSGVHDNQAEGLFLAGTVGTHGNTIVQRSSVRDNVAGGGYAGGIYSFTSMTIDQSEITGNSTTAVVGGVGAFDAAITSSTISGNTGPHAGGLYGVFSLTDSQLTDNTTGASGFGTGGGGQGIFTVLRSTISGNHSGLLGGGLQGVGSVTDSTVTGNDTSGSGGGLLAYPMSGVPGYGVPDTLTVTRSTVTGNTGHLAGGIGAYDDWSEAHSSTPPTTVHPIHLVISSSTVSGNTMIPSLPGVPAPPPAAADLAFAAVTSDSSNSPVGSLNATASVFGSAASAAPACELGPVAPVVSGGYNFSVDSSCLSGGTGDVVAGGDPGLTPLGDNGGPTLTMMPTGSSPLVDLIPSAFSTCGGTLDQRGVARPVGPACTIGAVEADRIVVTTTADVIDPSDGLLSLREAVALANATAGADTILLADGATYDLTICGADTFVAPNNSVGDLNATDVAGLTITGPTAGTSPTVHQTCPQGIIQSRQGGPTGAPLALRHLVLLGGGAASSAVAIDEGGPLVLDHVDLSGERTPPSGYVVGVGGLLTMTESAVHDNVGGAILVESGVPGQSTIERSSIRNNKPIGNAVAAGVSARSPLTVDHSDITGNGDFDSTGIGGVYSSGPLVTFTNSVIAANKGGFAGGLMGTFSLTDSQLVDNVGLNNGGGVGNFTVERSSISRNQAHFNNAGLAGFGTIADSTVSDNVAFDPVSGRPGQGGGVVTGDSTVGGSDGSLTIRNSTITGNRAAVSAGLTVLDHRSDSNTLSATTVAIESSTIAGNTLTPMQAGGSPAYTAAIEAADVTFARWVTEPAQSFVSSLTATSSVFGSGNAAAPSCSFGAASSVTSGGHNFGSDGSCLTGGPGDVVAGGDPGLSPLADHGGSTLTMVPTVGSPLIDRIPAGFSTCAGQVDQRGVARPVGGSCDIGAVESNAEVFPTEREFTPIVPQRLMDTRSDPAYHVGSQHRFGQGEAETLQVAGGTSPVPADASAAVVNITAVAPSAGSHVDVWPTGSAQPNVSNLNFTPGQTVANLAKVKIGASGDISLFNRNGSVDVIVDVVGYYRSDPTAARYTPIVPHRVADSRADPAYHVGTLTRLGDHSDVRALTVTGGTTGVPVGAKAVIANVTVVDPSAASHLDVWPAGTAHPNVSNINYTAGQTVPNLVVVKVSADGKIDLANANGSTDVIVDIVGYFTVDPTAAGFVATVPHRLVDTRADPAYHVGAQTRFGDRNDQRSIVVTGGVIPADATAIVANITVIEPTVASHLDVWPAGTTHPNVSNLNYLAGQTVPNLVTVKIGAGGAISLLNQNGSVDVIIDIVGYYR